MQRGIISMTRNEFSVDLPLPFAFRQCDADTVHIDNESNLRHFHVLQNLDHPETNNAVASDPKFFYLDQKLDILLALQKIIVSKMITLPPLQVLTLSANTITWRQATTLQRGIHLHVSLYLDATLPLAVEFAANTIDISENSVTAKYLFNDTQVQECYQQWLFIKHRKFIAQQQIVQTGNNT